MGWPYMLVEWQWYGKFNTPEADITKWAPQINIPEIVSYGAAENHLLVDFHGAYKPDGIIRTYPNMITREGVMGNEYYKFSDKMSPEHNVKLAFTRMLAG